MRIYIFLLSAVFMGLAQQPLDLGFFAWFSLVPVLFFLSNSQNTYKTLINYGFLWGLIYHLTFLYWISHNIGMPNAYIRYGSMLATVAFLSLNFIAVFSLYGYFVKKNFSVKVSYFFPIIFATNLLGSSSAKY